MAKRPGITEAHIRISLALLNSPAFIALEFSAKALFLDMRSKLRSTNNGNINAALSELAHRGWSAPATLAKALRQLEAVGLLRKTRKTVGVEKGSKVCNLYRFTDVETWAHQKLGIDAVKETHDYKAFTTLTDAIRAVKAASAPKTNPELRKNRALQKLKRNATETVGMGPFDATEFVASTPGHTTETVASSAPSKALKARAGAGCAPLSPIH